MDPLKKLEKQNIKYASIAKSERKKAFALMPFCFIALSVYSLFYIYLVTDIFDDDPKSLYVGVKQVWVLGMVFTAGVGSLFLAASLSLLIWAHLVAQKLNVKLFPFRPILFSTIFLIVSFLFFILGKQVDLLIHNNNEGIHGFLSFGYDTVHTIIIGIGNLLIMAVATLLGGIFMSLVLLPLKAKEDATEIFEAINNKQ